MRFDPVKASGSRSAACDAKIVYPYKSTYGSVDLSSAVAGIGPWNTIAGTFQAVPGVDTFSVVFGCPTGVAERIVVDDVVVELEPVGYNAY